MCRLALLFVCYITTHVAACCQDIITRSDGVKIEATVIETRLYQISYKLFASPQGPTYIINTADVLSIEFANGEKRIFDQPPESIQPAATIEAYENSLGKNILSLRIFDIFYPNLSLAYEHISAQGKFGIKIPVSIGLPKKENQYQEYDSYNQNKLFSSGVELNFYPNGQGRFRYFIGPALQVGFFRFNSYYYDWNRPFPEQRTYKGTHIALLVNNGIYYQFTPSFVVSLDGGIGLRNRSTRGSVNFYSQYQGTSLHASGNLNIGIRF